MTGTFCCCSVSTCCQTPSSLHRCTTEQCSISITSAANLDARLQLLLQWMRGSELHPTLICSGCSKIVCCDLTQINRSNCCWIFHRIRGHQPQCTLQGFICSKGPVVSFLNGTSINLTLVPKFKAYKTSCHTKDAQVFQDKTSTPLSYVYHAYLPIHILTTEKNSLYDDSLLVIPKQPIVIPIFHIGKDTPRSYRVIPRPHNHMKIPKSYRDLIVV